MQLQGKTAPITGAGAGIGEATARLFAQEGAQVVVADRDGERAESVAAGIGPQALAVAGDVSKAADVARMVAQAVARFGRIDILVNNAGYGIRASVTTTAEEDWDALMAVIRASIAKTNHAVVVNEGWSFCGYAAELSATIMDHCFDDLDAPVARVTLPDMPVPYSEPLENAMLPNAAKIRAAVLRVLA